MKHISTMSENGQTEPPSYIIPIDGQADENIYYIPLDPTLNSPESPSNSTPVHTLQSGDGKSKFVSYNMELGHSPGMTTCTSCQQQVMTKVIYKAGTYAWLMCLLFIIIGLLLCLIPMLVLPFIVKGFKDAHHTCPHCNRVLHIDKKKC